MALTKVDISMMLNTTGFTTVTKIVTVAASKYVIDGVSQDTLTLTEGYTYKFDTSHATNATHHFKFSTTEDGTHGSGVDYTTGVTYNGTSGSAGAYTQIVVAASAPTLYYWCHHHASMGGTANTPVAVIANKLLTYDSSGNLPLVDGSQLINPNTGVVESSSDPTLSTNPSGGVGTQWNNTTSGEVYICTDATAGANVWTNVGAGTGNVQPYSGIGGSSYGYASGGGANPGGPFVAQNVIEKWPFASNANATDVGNLTVIKYYCGGYSSSTHGYNFGGSSNTIDKWTFATDANATDVGDTTNAKDGACGSQSTDYGYSLGNHPSIDIIEKVSFTTDGNSVDTTANLTVGRSQQAGASSDAYGYCAGGQSNGTSRNVIDKHAFANSNNATDVGDLPSTNDRNTGTSSATYGYSMGGYPVVTAIEKWSFASDSNAVATSNTLTLARYYPCGVTSTTHGYAAGGRNNGSNVNNIDKFAFATDVAGADVGDLTMTRRGMSGQQY